MTTSPLNSVLDILDWWRHELVHLYAALLPAGRNAASGPEHAALCIGKNGIPPERPPLAGRVVPHSLTASVVIEDRALKLAAPSVSLPFSRSMDVGRALVRDETPFALEDVHVLPVPKSAEDRQPFFYVIKKAVIDRHLSNLHPGARPGRLGIAEGSQVIWVPHRALEDLHLAFRHLKRRRQTLLALASFLFLFGAGTYAHLLARYSSAENELAGTIETRRAEAVQVRKILDANEKSIATVEAARKGKEQSVPLVRIWEELTRALPDDVWITDLSVDGDEVRMAGFAAQSAASLIATLGSAAPFFDAEFISPVIRVPGQSGERFEIRTRVSPR